MNENILGSSTSYFVVGIKDNNAFPVRVNGFSAYRSSDIQSATWYQDSSTVMQMANLLSMFAQLNGDSTVFEGRKQLVEYTRVEADPEPEVAE